MGNWTSDTGVRLLSVLGALLIPLCAFAADPSAPSGICIDDRCNSPTVATTPGILKWHPGHYVLLDKNAGSTSIQAAHFAQMDALASNTAIKGFQIGFSWKTLEPTRDNYASGRAIMQAYLDKAASLAVPKRLMFVVHEREFGTANGSFPNSLPAYLESPEFNGGAYVLAAGGSGSLTSIAKSWEPPVMNRMIALTRYVASQFDSNPYLEMFSWEGETAVDGSAAAGGYSATGYWTQWQRMLLAAKAAFTRTQVRYWVNYSQSQNTEMTVAAFMAAHAISPGGPDTWVRTGTAWSDLVHQGKKWNGSSFVDGGIDYRSVVPWVAEVQSTAYFGGSGFPAEGRTFEQLYQFAYNNMHMSYMVWYRNEWAGNSSQMWPANLAFINAHPTVRLTSCPSSFAACDTK